MIHVQLNFQTPLADYSSWIMLSQSFYLQNLVRKVHGVLLSTKRLSCQKVWDKVKSENIFLGFMGICFNRFGLLPTRMNLSANVLLHCNEVFGWNIIEHLMNMLNKRALVNGLPQIPSLVLVGHWYPAFGGNIPVNQVLNRVKTLAENINGMDVPWSVHFTLEGRLGFAVNHIIAFYARLVTGKKHYFL